MYEGKGSGIMPTGVGQDKQDGAIERGLSVLDQTMEDAEVRLRELVGRLQPVCTVAPTDGNRKEQQAEPMYSPIATRINDATRRIERFAATINVLHATLDIGRDS